jgi:uncharacterized protein
MNNAHTASPVRSPCVKVCKLDDSTLLCMGCLRTQEERDWWVAYTNEQRLEVLRRCAQRREVIDTGIGNFEPSMGVVAARGKRGAT